MSTPAHRSAGPRCARRSRPPCRRSSRAAALPAAARAALRRPSRPRPSRRRTRRATRAAYRCRVRPRPARRCPARPSRRCAGPRCHAMSRWRQAAPSRSGRQRCRGCFLSAPTRSPATGGSEGRSFWTCGRGPRRLLTAVSKRFRVASRSSALRFKGFVQVIRKQLGTSSLSPRSAQ